MTVVQDDFSHPTETQSIVKILSSKGNNLHEVENPDGSVFLVSMPTKFRKNVWVKRGDFVLMESIEEGDKVKGEMVRILTKEHIKYFKEDGVWPAAFLNHRDSKQTSDDTELFVNNNRSCEFVECGDNDNDSEDVD